MARKNIWSVLLLKLKVWVWGPTASDTVSLHCRFNLSVVLLAAPQVHRLYRKEGTLYEVIFANLFSNREQWDHRVKMERQDLLDFLWVSFYWNCFFLQNAFCQIFQSRVMQIFMLVYYLFPKINHVVNAKLQVRSLRVSMIRDAYVTQTFLTRPGEPQAVGWIHRSS